jgi:hypothetical protein
MRAAKPAVMQEHDATPLHDDDILEITELPADELEAAPRDPESGKAGYAIAWLLGVPLPILLIVYLISRC